MIILTVILIGLIILNLITYITLCKREDRMNWHTYKEQNKPEPAEYYEATNMLCPDCGSPIYKYTGVALTTYPIQYRYDCPKCNWSKVM